MAVLTSCDHLKVGEVNSYTIVSYLEPPPLPVFQCCYGEQPLPSCDAVEDWYCCDALMRAWLMSGWRTLMMKTDEGDGDCCAHDVHQSSHYWACSDLHQMKGVGVTVSDEGVGVTVRGEGVVCGRREEGS